MSVRTLPKTWLPRLVGGALAIAILACTRGDVPAPAGIGSGGLPEPPTATATPGAGIEQTPTVAAPPTATSTPFTLQPPASPTFPPTPTIVQGGASESISYEAQPGDTLWALAVRFGVIPTDITSTEPLPGEHSLVNPGQLLFIPRRLSATGPADRLIPDSEVVFSPYAADFDVEAFAAEQGGYLNRYSEYINSRLRTGPQVVAQVARDNSVNPRLLLALLEYQTGWVTDPTRPSGGALTYPMGNRDPALPGLFRQLTWLANELGVGYYSWRAGTLTEIPFPDDTTTRLAPDLNAGTVSLQYFLALRLSGREWAEALSPQGFMATYTRFFGDPWTLDYPLFVPGVQQPPLILPFPPGRIWAFTGGPHGAWEREAAWAALDFAPSTSQTGCMVSEDWAVAAAPGLVLRSGGGVVVLDLDGDGREQTGWVLIYLHIADVGRARAGDFVEEGDRIGHPSCQGGVATGTHVHFVRKYNGEWILADGPLSFNLSGWVAHAGARPYEGSLTQDGRTVIACSCASQETYISR